MIGGAAVTHDQQDNVFLTRQVHSLPDSACILDQPLQRLADSGVLLCGAHSDHVLGPKGRTCRF